MIPQVVSAQQLKLRVTIAVHGLLNQIDIQANKGGLISESFSLWLSPPNNVPNHYPEYIFFGWIVIRTVIWHIFCRIEKLSYIKPPLNTLLTPEYRQRTKNIQL
jgi:hypothetical protein